MENIKNAIEIVSELEQKYELSIEDTKKIKEQFHKSSINIQKPIFYFW